jgi:hypothetical protein
MTPRRPALSALVAACLTVPGAGGAADRGCPDLVAPRVVAVGDVHGAYEGFLSVLRFAGLADERGHWAGGKAHLVQTGDVLDRGKDAPKVLDLLMRLESEARRAGGSVHALLGNHEVMNVLGDLRYVNLAEYEHFRTPDSIDRRARFLRTLTDYARERAREAGEAFDTEAYRSKLLEEIPLGFVERTVEFSAEGRYGRWLRRRPVMVKVNGVVFLHGGLTPEVAALGCEAVTETVRREITKDIDKTRAQPQASLAAGEAGPLWYRGYWKQDEAALLPAVESVLQALAARAIVVGHTVTGTGRIQSRLGGRVVGIDIGMGEVYGAHLGALEVGPDGTLTALYPEGREEILRPAAAARAAPLPSPPEAVPARPGSYGSRLAYASREEPSFPTSTTPRRGRPPSGKSMRMKPGRAARKSEPSTSRTYVTCPWMPLPLTSTRPHSRLSMTCRTCSCPEAHASGMRSRIAATRDWRILRYSPLVSSWAEMPAPRAAG